MKCSNLRHHHNKSPKSRILHTLWGLFLLLFFLLPGARITAATKNLDLILIGDSRTVDISTYVTKPDILSPNTLINKKKTLGSQRVCFLGKYGARYSYWFTNQDQKKVITSTLNKARDGAYCMIWMGVNDLRGDFVPDYLSSRYAKAVGQLASSYPKVQFVYVLVTHINESLYAARHKDGLDNLLIDEFNDSLARELKKEKTYGKNLSYLGLNARTCNLDGKVRTVKSQIASRTDFCQDGLHYQGNHGLLYLSLFNLMRDHTQMQLVRGSTCLDTMYETTPAKTIKLAKGKTSTLKLTFADSIPARNLTWTTDNSKIVSITPDGPSCKIKGKKAGSTQISLKIKGCSTKLSVKVKVS